MYQKRKWKDVLTIIGGKNQKAVETVDGKYPIYGSGGIIGHASSFLCPAKTVIVGRKGTIDRPIYVEEPFWNIDTAFGVVAGEELLPKYLYFFCLSYNFKSLDKSTGRPSVSKSDLLKIEMPLPSLKEQTDTVTRIEELFSELDKGVETLQTIKQQLAVYRQAVLKEAFDNGAQNVTLSSVCDFITKGTTHPKGSMTSSVGEIPFIKVYNLTFNSELDFTIEPTFVTREVHKNFLKRSITLPGDVLMNIVGPPLGKVSIVPKIYSEWNINQAIARFRCLDKIYNKYLAYFLCFSETVKKMTKKTKATAGQQNLTLEICRNILIPLPNINAQHRIVGKIESRLSVCDSIEQTVDTALAQAESMRQSILKKAFEGGFSE